MNYKYEEIEKTKLHLKFPDIIFTIRISEYPNLKKGEYIVLDFRNRKIFGIVKSSVYDSPEKRNCLIVDIEEVDKVPKNKKVKVYNI